MNTRLSVLLSALLLVSCVHKYAVPLEADSPAYLAAAATVYVTTPPDGRDDNGRTYKNSGDWTRSAFADGLSDRGVQVIPGGSATNPAEAIAAAKSAGADFLVLPHIVHWSDRVTEWSGIPDRITIEINIYEVTTGAKLNERKIRASSRWATFGGDHPQELLPELARRWAEAVMQ